MPTFTLTNDFHNTRALVKVTPSARFHNGYELSAHQVRRVRKRLCPCSDCTCGDSLGMRGTQSDVRGVERVSYNNGPAVYTLLPRV